LAGAQGLPAQGFASTAVTLPKLNTDASARVAKY